MVKDILKKEIMEKIEAVKHPMINESLRDLGIIKNTKVRGSKVEITLALPFAEIPIKQGIISSVKKPLDNITDKIKIMVTTMNEAERQKFFDMEKKSWKGDKA